MKVFLLKDIEKVGLAGEMLSVKEGFATNYLIPRKLAVKVTTNNEAFFKKRARSVEQRKEVVASKTSMLAEKIHSLKLTIKKKSHDNGKLYGAVNASDVVAALKKHGVTVSKNQITFGKSIKEKGTYNVTIKLSSQLKPNATLQVVPE